MNDQSSWPELRRALLDETEPAPGMEQRVLSGARPVPGGQRPSWALGAIAVALAILVVATLMLAGQLLRQTAVPASPPSPLPRATQPPPAISTHALSSATLGPDGTGWVLEHVQQPPLVGEVVLWHTTDAGAHWSSQLDLTAGKVELYTGPRDQALLYVTGLNFSEPAQSFFYSTTDGGAHWQRFPTPAPEPIHLISVREAREAWLIADVFTSPTQPPNQWAVYHTTDGAQTWQRQATVNLAATFGSSSTGGTASFRGQYGVFVPQPAVGVGARIYTTADGGDHWRSAPAPPELPSQGIPVPILLPDGHLALLRQNSLYVSDDGGLHWSEARPLPGPATSGPAALDTAHWWWISGDGRVFFSRDEGASWAQVGSLPRGMTPGAVTFQDPDDGLMVTSHLRPATAANVLLATSDGGRTWRPINPPHPFRPAVACGIGATVKARANLRLTYNSQVQPSAVPAGVGVTDACRYRLFTPDASGTIDISSTPSESGRTYTLGDFLDVWGVPDVQSIAPYVGAGVVVSVLVDGSAYPGDPRTIPLHDGTKVVVQVTGPTRPA
jgi:photosystem II stability/assembly factor-like uncharacterized protein